MAFDFLEDIRKRLGLGFKFKDETVNYNLTSSERGVVTFEQPTGMARSTPSLIKPFNYLNIITYPSLSESGKRIVEGGPLFDVSKEEKEEAIIPPAKVFTPPTYLEEASFKMAMSTPTVLSEGFIGDPKNPLHLITNTMLDLPDTALREMGFLRLLTEPLPKSSIGKAKVIGNEVYNAAKFVGTLIARIGVSAVSLFRDEPIEEQIKQIPFIGNVPTMERTAYDQLLAGVSPFEVGLGLFSEAAIATSVFGGMALKAIRALEPTFSFKKVEVTLSRQDLQEITTGGKVTSQKMDAFKQGVGEGVTFGQLLREGKPIVIEIKTPNVIGKILYQPVDKGLINKIILTATELKPKPAPPGALQLPGLVPIEPGMIPMGMSIQPMKPVGKGVPEKIPLVGKIPEVLKKIKKDGGITINLEGVEPTEGFSYAPDKTTERVIPIDKVSGEDILKYVKDNFEQLKQSGNNVGVWSNTEDGNTYLDVSRVGKPDIDTLMEAWKSKQLSVWDLKNSLEIKTPYYYESTYSINLSRKQDARAISQRSLQSYSEILKSKEAGREVDEGRIFTKAEIERIISKEALAPEKLTLEKPPIGEGVAVEVGEVPPIKGGPSVERLGIKEKPRMITKREDVLLRQKLRVEKKAAKMGVKVGVKLTKEQIREKIAVKKLERKEANQIRKQIGFQRHTKDLGSSVMARLKKVHGIKEYKNASAEELKPLLEDIKKFKKGTRFLTNKQITGLKHYIKVGEFGKDPLLITQQEMIQKFRESEDLLNKAIFDRFIPNELFPTVDVKEGHPVLKRIVDNADIELRKQIKMLKGKFDFFEKSMSRAEKSRKQGILKRETGRRIFKKLSGFDVELTKEEQAVVDFLKKEFKWAKEAVNLQKWRKNYITNIEKPLMEKILDKGLIKAIKDYIKPDQIDIPIDIMLALDNIIGSEKFFRFALRREGMLDPTTNIRKIFKDYFSLVHTKIALDKVLPEALAAHKLLLKNRSALWLKKYMQNLKGRGLDYKIRQEKGKGWALKVTDKFIDFGYFRFLAGNIKSGIKNLIGGETNSFIYQTFSNYLKGKKRLFLNPVKSYKMISDSGVLEGTYVNIVSQNLVQRGKKFIEHIAYGQYEITEYELRGSYFLGELTDQEWKTGSITPKRFREILDGIAITQGIYTKVDSPLFVQTTIGRSIMQFGRWRITNAMLLRRIAKGARAEWKQGNFTGENTRKFFKMMITTTVGMYLAYEAGKAGNKAAQQIAKAAAELLLSVLNPIGTVYEAIAENPVLQTLGSIAYTAQQLASYITFGLIEEPSQIEIQGGIDKLYFSFLKTLGAYEKKGESKFDYLKKGRETKEGKFDYLRK